MPPIHLNISKIILTGKSSKDVHSVFPFANSEISRSLFFHNTVALEAKQHQTLWTNCSWAVFYSLVPSCFARKLNHLSGGRLLKWSVLEVTIRIDKLDICKFNLVMQKVVTYQNCYLCFILLIQMFLKYAVRASIENEGLKWVGLYKLLWL